MYIEGGDDNIQIYILSCDTVLGDGLSFRLNLGILQFLSNFFVHFDMDGRIWMFLD